MSLFTEAVEALYGPYYQGTLARALEVNERTVRRWIAGEAEIPAGVWSELIDLMRERAAALRALAARIAVDHA